MSTLGERIKETRESIPMTQEELGKAIGVTGVTIMRYEKGQREPSLEHLQNLSKVLKVSPEYLVGWYDSSVLRHLRQSYGLTQEELAEQTGLSIAQIQLAEEKSSKLTLNEWSDIMAALGAPIDRDSQEFQSLLELETEIEQRKKDLRQLEYEIRDSKLRVAFAKLNEKAQLIAIERLEELAKIPEYQNPDFPDNFEFPDNFFPEDMDEPDDVQD